MYYVYVLKSVINNQLYIGSTNDLKRRFAEHNKGKEFSTKRYMPWNLMYYEAFETEHLARLREKSLKHHGNAIKELKKRIGVYPAPKNGAGFTLLELIIVIAIVFTVGALSTSFYARFFTQNAVSNTTDQLVGELRKAQMYAMMGKQNSNWGVHFAPNTLTLYKGSSFGADPNFNETFSVNSNISLNGFSDLNFSRMTGTPSASPTITISGANNSKSIIINSQGV